MKFSAKISSLALASVLALSGAAYAQTMVAGISVSEADLPKVQAQCDALADAQANASLTKDGTTSTDTATDANSASTDASTATNNENAVDVNGADQATTSIDLEILTYENCKEAGLVK